MALVTKSFSDIITFTRASGATWFNSAGILQGVDFSVTSNTIGTGSKTFTLTATGGVNRYWTAGDTVLISDQANSANNMVGTVTSYNASTQVLVCNITSTGGSGTLTAWRIGNLMQRLDYNPATLAARGLLIEEARTNSIRNNTMQGAVAGTPGTLPTNWNVFTSLTGLTSSVVGTGTENGITYLDFRVSGTPSGAGPYLVFFESGVQIAAISGQTWTVTSYLKLQAGSLSGITSVRLYLQENNASGAYLTEQNFAVTNPTNAALNTQRGSGTRTLNQATTAFLLPGFNLLLTGAAIDITLRIGLPQLELGAFATSVIPTTTTALTRSADVASVNTLAPWFNSTAGTLYAEYSRFGAVNFQACAVLGEATFQNSISLGFGSGAPSNNNRFDVNASGSSQASITLLTNPALNTVAKTAGAYATNDFAGTANGAVPGTDTSGTVPSGIAVLSIGCNSALNGGFLNGYLRRITYYPRKLSSAELQAITA